MAFFRFSSNNTSHGIVLKVFSGSNGDVYYISTTKVPKVTPWLENLFSSMAMLFNEQFHIGP